MKFAINIIKEEIILVMVIILLFILMRILMGIEIPFNMIY